ncbi:MAG: S24 family peptidase [Saprospiraceae bacterium]|nr:S24 family peptidase [Saprospiraceae bacterium]
MNSVVTQRFIKCHDKLREDNRVRSSRQFAINLEYLPQSLSEILKGRRDVTIELIRKSVELYNMNPVYLFTGEGPMFMSEEAHQDFRVLTIVTNSTEDERIVHVPVPAQAGYAGEIANPAFIQDLPTFTLPDYKYKVGTHRSFDVSGDSMEPTLFEGDKVVCSYVEPTLWESTIKDNHVYVIVTHGDVVIKRVINKLAEGRILELHSDNDFYNMYRLNATEIREMWYVRAKISPFLPASPNSKNHLHGEISDLKLTVGEQLRLIQNLQINIEKLLPGQGL